MRGLTIYAAYIGKLGVNLCAPGTNLPSGKGMGAGKGTGAGKGLGAGGAEWGKSLCTLFQDRLDGNSVISF